MLTITSNPNKPTLLAMLAEMFECLIYAFVFVRDADEICGSSFYQTHDLHKLTVAQLFVLFLYS